MNDVKGMRIETFYKTFYRWKGRGLFYVIPFLIVLFIYNSFLYANEQDKIKAKDPIYDVRVENNNSQVKIAWKIRKDFKLNGKTVKGFRLYKLGHATRKICDISTDKNKERVFYTVRNLKNGEQYRFLLKAYDKENKEFWQRTVFGFPGTKADGRTQPPKNMYISSGDGRVAIFWDKNEEVDLIGYEVYRKGEGDVDLRLVKRIPKVFGLAEKTKEKKDVAKFFQAIVPTMYIDTEIENGRTYEYKVRALDSEGHFSDFTSTVRAWPKPYSSPSGDEIILLVNSNSGDSNKDGINDSEEVALYYAEKRKVSTDNIIRFNINRDKYRFNYARDIQKPLRKHLLKKNLAGKIKYIVPCYGIPIGGAGRALDSQLADLFDRFTWGTAIGTPNSYFNSGKHFDGTYGIYLVTRIDGPSVEIAKSIIDKALYAEDNVTARNGKAYFGNWGKRNSIGDKAIKRCAKIAKDIGISVVFKDPGKFDEHELGDDAYWYFAWYHHYKNPIKDEWPAGAVGAHLISYSFKAIREKDPKRLKSWVQGLLEKGITATFGSVIEPYLQGFTRADIFFEYFWSGEYNFAESFYMATPTVQWAMSAVGDPLFRLKKPPLQENKLQ